MCSKCKELDDRIARYQRLRTSILDDLTSNGVAELIEQAMAQKLALQPEEKE
jgi:hypothetical protein